MASAALNHFITVDDYLAGELISEVKHEYVDGKVYAMAGASRSHIEVSGNCYAALRNRLMGGPCTPYFSDLKVRMMIRGKDIFYYPDLVVACDPRDNDRHSLRFPKLIIEVLSVSTNRIDRHEKLLNYTTIPSLEEYMLVEQERAQVIIHRKRTDWLAETTEGLDAIIHLESVDLTLPLSRVYENIAGIA